MISSKINRLFILLVFSGYISAQGWDTGGQKISGSVWGQLLSDAGDPVGFSLLKFSHLRDTSYITGALTDEKGKFRVEDIKPGRYLLTIDYLAYEKYTDTVSVLPPVLNLDLGKITLLKSAKQLDEVVIADERDHVSHSLDKKVYTLENNSLITGGTTLDALKQLSLIQIDTENKISVRGEGRILFLVNGKPSGMTMQNPEQFLEQLPASSVDRIEIISNPSAAYDAEGTGGIINIVTKKKVWDGQFTTLSFGIGSGNKYNASIAWNLRKNKWTQSLHLGFRRNQHKYNSYNRRFNFRTLYNDTLIMPDSTAIIPFYDAFYLHQDSYGYKYTDGSSLTYNAEYDLDERNMVNAGIMVNYGPGGSSDVHSYMNLDSLRNPYSRFDRHIDTGEDSRGIDGTLGYLHRFINNKGDINLSGLYSTSKKGADADYKRSFFFPDGLPTGAPDLLEDSENLAINKLSTAQADVNFTPYKKHKLSAGVKYQWRNMDNDFLAHTLDTLSETYITDLSQTNHFTYTDRISAAYLNYSNSWKSWSFQTGIRGEYIDVNTWQEINNLAAGYQDLSFFPSVYLTYKTSGGYDMQASYSRRINRPSIEQLNPFNTRNDPYNQFLGNPYLKSEYTDALELSIIKYLGSTVINVNTYIRLAHDVHMRLRSIDENNLSTVSWRNLDQSITAGVEPSIKGKITKWWNYNLNGSFFYKTISGDSQDDCQSFERRQNNWSIRGAQTFQIRKTQELQWSINYMSPFVFPQGKGNMRWGMDLGYKIDILNGRGTISANLSDVLNTREFNLTMNGLACGDGYNFDGSVFRKRESRILNLSFSYRFGKSDTKTPKKIFSSEQRGGDMEF